MFCLNDALSFVRKLNESVRSFISTNKETIANAKKECEIADRQAQEFTDDLNRKLNEYKIKNFGSIISSIERLLETLREEYPEEYKTAKGKNRNYAFDSIEEGLKLLNDEASIFNQ